ncbi:MAG TPA: hypothetical protein PKY59_19015, partial [Pyrinomonadaceae bacterium]|nr:hypothetical protein [Pyrinomonadaceae bacterium]
MRKQNKFKTVVVFLLLQCVLLTNIAFAQFGQQAKPEETKPLPKLDGINGQIQDEGMNRSQLMRTLHFLSDVYGARLTGSPNHKAAADWVVKQMNEWKLDNAALEPWDFGHPGWVNERASGFMLSPAKDNLTFEVLAWTPSTKGVVKGDAFQMVLPERPTQEELTAYLTSV